MNNKVLTFAKATDIGDVAYQLISLCYKLRCYILQSKPYWLTRPGLLKTIWVVKCDFGGRENKLASQIRYKRVCALYKKIKSRPSVDLLLLHF